MAAASASSVLLGGQQQFVTTSGRDHCIAGQRPHQLARVFALCDISQLETGHVDAENIAGAQPRFPLAIIPVDDASLIGARTRVAVLSDSDVFKQRVRAEQGDTFRALPSTYRSIADIVRDFTIRGRDGDNTMLYAMMREDGRYLCVVMQRTASGQGLFIKSVRVQASRTIDRFFSGAVDIVDRRN